MKLQLSICLTTVLLILGVIGASVRAGEPAVNPSGTWKLALTSTNTLVRPTENTLKLKLAGGTLTGTLSNVSTVNGKSRVYNWAIKEAKLQGNEISFTVTHPFEVGHGIVTTRYEGKIEGDTIKGTCKIEFSGHTYTRGWEAERVKE